MTTPCLGACPFLISLCSDGFSLGLVSSQGNPAKDCGESDSVQAMRAPELPVLLRLLLLLSFLLMLLLANRA